MTLAVQPHFEELVATLFKEDEYKLGVGKDFKTTSFYIAAYEKWMTGEEIFAGVKAGELRELEKEFGFNLTGSQELEKILLVN